MTNLTSEQKREEWKWVEQIEAKLRIIKDMTSIVTTEDGRLDKARSLGRLHSSYAALQKLIAEVDAHNNE